jgi:hypothetical protein
VVRDCEDADLIADDGVDETVGKAAHPNAALSATPDRAETGVLKEKTDGVLELGEQGLG